MALVVFIPGYLREFTGGVARVVLDDPPPSVGAALDRLWALHPGTRDRVLTEAGEVRPHVNIFVGLESIRWSGGLATALRGDEEITIVPAVSGGNG